MEAASSAAKTLEPAVRPLAVVATAAAEKTRESLVKPAVEATASAAEPIARAVSTAVADTAKAAGPKPATEKKPPAAEREPEKLGTVSVDIVGGKAGEFYSFDATGAAKQLIAKLKRLKHTGIDATTGQLLQDARAFVQASVEQSVKDQGIKLTDAERKELVLLTANEMERILALPKTRKQEGQMAEGLISIPDESRKLSAIEFSARDALKAGSQAAAAKARTLPNQPLEITSIGANLGIVEPVPLAFQRQQWRDAKAAWRGTGKR